MRVIVIRKRDERHKDQGHHRKDNQPEKGQSQKGDMESLVQQGAHILCKGGKRSPFPNPQIIFIVPFQIHRPYYEKSCDDGEAHDAVQ